METKNPYQTLGVKEDARWEDIQSAYRQMARQYHPDTNPGDAVAEEKFKEVAYAYRVLKDPGSRLLYDTTGLPELPPLEREIQGVLMEAFKDALEKDAPQTIVAAHAFIKKIQDSLMEQKEQAFLSQTYLKDKRSKVTSKDHANLNLFHLLVDKELRRTAGALAMINFRLDVVAGCFARLETYVSTEQPPPPPKGFAHEFVMVKPNLGIDFEAIVAEELRKKRELNTKAGKTIDEGK